MTQAVVRKTVLAAFSLAAGSCATNHVPFSTEYPMGCLKREQLERMSVNELLATFHGDRDGARATRLAFLSYSVIEQLLALERNNRLVWRSNSRAKDSAVGHGYSRVLAMDIHANAIGRTSGCLAECQRELSPGAMVLRAAPTERVLAPPSLDTPILDRACWQGAFSVGPRKLAPDDPIYPVDAQFEPSLVEANCECYCFFDHLVSRNTSLWRETHEEHSPEQYVSPPDTVELSEDKCAWLSVASYAAGEYRNAGKNRARYIGGCFSNFRFSAQGNVKALCARLAAAK